MHCQKHRLFGRNECTQPDEASRDKRGSRRIEVKDQPFDQLALRITEKMIGERFFGFPLKIYQSWA